MAGIGILDSELNSLEAALYLVLNEYVSTILANLDDNVFLFRKIAHIESDWKKAEVIT